MVQVSIVIVSYNTEKLLKRCLESIYSYLTFPLEVIIVDNASSDNSSQMVKQTFSKVILIQNKKNEGFAKGCNIGTKYAKGEYILFLNSDTELIDTSIEEMVQFLKNNKEVAIVGGQLVNKDGSKQYSYGSFFSVPVLFAYLLFGEVVFGRSEGLEEKKVDWVSGGFMMIKASVFRQLTGFDENLFMYIEDMELCFRAKKLGYSTYFLPSVKALHRGQGSSNRTFAIVHIYKGILYFYKKHKNTIQYSLVKSLLLSKAFAAIFLGTITFNRYLTKTYKKAVQF